MTYPTSIPCPDPEQMHIGFYCTWYGLGMEVPCRSDTFETFDTFETLRVLFSNFQNNDTGYLLLSQEKTCPANEGPIRLLMAL